jgi:uncharacterized membrane protein (UPF0182 family)
MKLMKYIVPALLFLFIMLISLGSRLYIDWIWFAEQGLTSVIATVLSSFWGIRLAAWLLFSLFFFINLSFTQKALLDMPNLALRQALMNTSAGNLLTKSRLRTVFLLISLIIPWILTAYLGEQWLPVRLFLAGGETGIVDPLLARDVGFYLFGLPFWQLAYGYAMMVVVTPILFCGAIYLLINPPQELGLRSIFSRRGQAHLSVLLALTFLLRAFGYRLQTFMLLFSERGATFGAGYTDYTAQLPALRILMLLSLIAAAALLLNVKLRNSKLITGSIAALIVGSILLGGVYPALIQNFVVEPNEFEREKEFLEYNIHFTQLAYNINEIERRDFPLTGTLGYEELLANEGTINNIRLWDWRPLRQTFGQLQGLRRYYRFHDVDTDRYMIDGNYSQIMLAARELVVEELPARNWINEHLIYTHGYGAVASPVNEVTSQGLPQLLVRDLPVRGVDGLQVDVPQIYFGELTKSYIFTGATTNEFDYPLGDTNAFTRYTGTGGVPLGGLARRSLFALRFSDYRILISPELQQESRVHFYRNIRERVSKIAPFLRYDGDPYLVIDEGRMYWMIDAYTVSNRFPYAQPVGNINYIRNSVKVVVDAYNGTVQYYIFEPDDPLIQAYAKIFPGLFQSVDDMPAGIRKHIRYPEELFKIQSRMYATYHMENIQVFYNREDQWEWPKEIYASSPITMEPYYTIITLPEENEPEFVLMLPYTPYNRDNMVAWLAGRSDGEKYGQLIVYEFPKGELLYGPSQIEARIDQDSRISEQLTLWDQRGSNVIRGNLLVLPINGSVLYVEPIFLQSEQGQLPELTRVIVAYGERVVMERTLEEALTAVFGLQPGERPDRPTPGEPAPDRPGTPDTPGTPVDATVQELIDQASRLFNQAQEAVQRGDWAEYGRLQQQLGTTLTRLQQQLNQ